MTRYLILSHHGIIISFTVIVLRWGFAPPKVVIWLLSGTLNQWSSRSGGVTCSDLRAENTSRAAAFNTDYSRRSWVSDTPTSTELQ